jgi:membrane protease YdiL (CAAX protease family)
MSILGDYAAPILLASIAVAVPALVAWLVGAFRPSAHPRPIPTGPKAWYLAFVLVISLFFYLTVQVFYFGAKQALGSTATSRPLAEDLTVKDWAFLATVPPICALLALLAGDWAVGGRALLRDLGISLSRLPRGITNGAAGVLIILPPVWLCLVAISWVYDHVQFHHPQEHELLLMMREAHALWVRVVLVLAACVVAPVSEEYLFRGHVQTLMRRLMIRWTTRRPSPPLIPDYAGQAGIVLEYNTLAVTLPEESPGVDWRAWAAIVLTSMLFAVVHPLWMFPPIFLLAVGLGYAYERTGNLWTPIIIHCVFNSISTTIYLVTKH